VTVAENRVHVHARQRPRHGPKVSKRFPADLVSLRYKDLELLGASGHPYGYWSQRRRPGPRVSAAVTIDPKTN